ncbi:hypothetical protein C0W92_00580 [Photobacterium angustum]|uniref:Uncharacterized protein n=2 Tax=Photobacterium angustum TaxID=661 RepID=A0A855S7N5_PHOAN|nr:hypothetical protein [Photobacterium angustum]KJF83247.1 hypothetical protein UB36_01265 [Photobacterium damselae subsp. damselae]KJG29088.1 hypothetical protein UA69_14560 [Photobacterium angustum]KJG42909.1 hypothetical protein UA35_02780 [Photobacterium angustum]KJG47555.1 hypothetical protein UA31_01265 [Photobacterium angustum]KJG49198.1 hypothetical protein UA30_08385 [Photobacterium angustum]
MRMWLLFAISTCIFGYSLWFSHNQFVNHDNFSSELRESTYLHGDWHILTKVNFTNNKYTAEVFVDGSGIDETAIFREKGRLYSFYNGSYRVKSDLTLLQQAKVDNASKASPYTHFLFTSQQGKYRNFKMIYNDQHVVIIHVNDNDYVQLYVKSNPSQ